MPTIGGVMSSDINLGLPSITRVTSNQMDVITEFQDILTAFRMLQQELSAAKARIKSLEDYNIAHP